MFYCTHNITRMQFDEKKFRLRERDQHLEDCDELEAYPSDERSRDLGINSRSILFELQYFDVDVLVPDVMHDLLEGVLQYEASQVLKHVIRQEHYLRYSAFAKALDGLELGYMESDNRPTHISTTTVNSDEKSLGQKG